MLFNLLTVGKDFEKSMRQRWWLALWLLAVVVPCPLLSLRLPSGSAHRPEALKSGIATF